ncbi:molybdopterin oxidoreductase [Oceanidesulfovibrio indonesiensis]|uniref:Molybdopterin oxidoreductase n=1 Tax=Oceanidesulfovibrio indonesiensis TaxID=54767 RepID=A0A7M3MIW1_9BACT|nr:menaquinone reductase molybdopterin-binding-like subunit QrcB [Oceanidesulfovibrio indonesiensis]TVM19724.1 molybdopterin oxidoreductase [Oceanidesulfovibrio indonesiensis]
MGIDRRDVIKFIVGGAVGSTLTPIPWKLTDDISIWTQNWPWIPTNIGGKNEYTPTVSKLCPSNSGMLLRTVSGRPVRPQGDPDSPLSGGKISSLAAAEAQMLYSPSRVRRPLRKTSDGTYKAVSWAEAEAILSEKLGNATGGVGVISGDENGSMNEVLSALAAGFGSDDCHFMPGSAQAEAVAYNQLMGGEGQPAYDFEKADYVLAIGADVLESWGPVVATRRAYADMRPHGEDPKSTWVYAGAFQTNTAAGADRFVAMRPGAQVALALGVANLLIKEGASATGLSGFASLAAQYTPEKVAEVAGVSPDALQEIAKGLASAQKPLVVVGAEGNEGGSTAAAIAGIACNMLLGSFKAVPYPRTVVQGAMGRGDMLAKDVASYVAGFKGGKAPEVLITYQANPVYALPGSIKTKEAFENVSFKVCFTTYLSETALASDLILPVPHSLEMVDDVATPYGYGKALYAVARPLVPTLVDAKHPGDFLLGLGAKLGKDLGFASYQKVLEAKARAMGANWADVSRGTVYVSDSQASTYGVRVDADAVAKAAAVVEVADLTLCPVMKLNFGTANCGIPPFNLNTIRGDELDSDYLYAHLNASTAKSKGVAQGDVVRISSAAGTVMAKVNIFEGVMDGVVAIPKNFGHTAFDEFTRGKGDNVSALFAVASEPGTQASVWTGQAVELKRA